MSSSAIVNKLKNFIGFGDEFDDFDEDYMENEIEEIQQRTEEKIIKISDVSNELIYNYYNQSTWRGFKVIPFSNPDISKYLPDYKNKTGYRLVLEIYDNKVTGRKPIYKYASIGANR